MRTIIAGSREGATIDDIKLAIDECTWSITTVISGTARGVDQLGEQWAQENDIPIERFPADWHDEGTRAGYWRNARMAAAAQALIAVWDGQSSGTRSMIDLATRKGLIVSVYRLC